MEGRPASNPALVRTYCRSCDNHMSNDKMGDDGKPARRVSTAAAAVAALAPSVLLCPASFCNTHAFMLADGRVVIVLCSLLACT